MADDGDPAIVTEVAPPHRLRITERGTPRLWAAGDAPHWGMTALIAEPFAALPRFAAADCRAVGEAHPSEVDWWTAWGLRFAAELRRYGPMGRGAWVLDRAEIGVPHWPQPHTRRGLLLLVVDLDDERAAGSRVVDVHWSMAGENAHLAMRPLTDADDGRLAGFRKLAAARLLPPALLWWHTGLQAHMVLDGHVRIAAFRAAGVEVRALVLREQRPSREDPAAERACEARVEELHRVVADPVVRNREIAKLYDFPARFRHSTTARHHPGGAEAWDREVAARLPEYGARVLATLEQ